MATKKASTAEAEKYLGMVYGVIRDVPGLNGAELKNKFKGKKGSLGPALEILEHRGLIVFRSGSPLPGGLGWFVKTMSEAREDIEGAATATEEEQPVASLSDAAIASVLKGLRPSPTATVTFRALWHDVAAAFAERLARTNPRFDPLQFQTDCGGSIARRG